MSLTKEQTAAKPRQLPRERILEMGMELIALGGFNATGLDAILKRAAIPKGSFYYYFRSKEDFGLAVIDHCAARAESEMKAALVDADGPPLVRLRTYFERGVAAQEMKACRRGCLIGNLGQELAGQSETFRKRVDEVFGSWEKLFAGVLAEAQKRGDVSAKIDVGRMAGYLLTGWEGAILRAKVMQSARPMKEFVRLFFENLERT